MKFRFSVTAFVDRHARLGVVGSTPELGLWNAKACIPLLPFHVNNDEGEPSMWSGVVAIDIDAPGGMKQDIEYKFIRWSVPEALPATDSATIFPLDNETSFPQPAVHTQTMTPPDPTMNIVWEGSGALENRTLRFPRKTTENGDDKHQTVERTPIVTPHAFVHLFSPEDDCLEDNVYTLPVYEFREPHEELTEYSHTTRSYLRIKNALRMHYNRVLNRVVVGTCPRKKEHLLYLMEHENISDVLNMQTADDIRDNFPLDGYMGPRIPDVVADVYESLGLRYVWLPMEDMSSTARARGVAQAVVLLAALLKRKGCTGVYVHCNAGVGRSTACVAGLIHCIMGASLRLTNLLINARRPVAFFDEDAIKRAAQDFEFKFSGIAEALGNSQSDRKFSLS